MIAMVCFYVVIVIVLVIVDGFSAVVVVESVQLCAAC